MCTRRSIIIVMTLLAALLTGTHRDRIGGSVASQERVCTGEHMATPASPIDGTPIYVTGDGSPIFTVTSAGRSMEPAVPVDTVLLVDGAAYVCDSPQRGDIVAFEPPTLSDVPYIKRVVGLPGEVVEIENGAVVVDGKELAEPYVRSGTTECIRSKCDPVVVPEGEVYVLGDNRSNSSDSRIFGPISVANIIGKAWFVFEPGYGALLPVPAYQLLDEDRVANLETRVAVLEGGSDGASPSPTGTVINVSPSPGANSAIHVKQALEAEGLRVDFAPGGGRADLLSVAGQRLIVDGAELYVFIYPEGIAQRVADTDGVELGTIRVVNTRGTPVADVQPLVIVGSNVVGVLYGATSDVAAKARRAIESLP